jgi:hypothetical protein
MSIKTKKATSNMKMNYCGLVASGLPLALMAILGGANASAATITINDPSFETPAVGCSGSGCFSSLGNFGGFWTGSGVTATFSPTAGSPGSEFDTPLPDGVQVAVAGASGLGGEFFQDLSATLEANTTYDLTFYIGQRNDALLATYTVSLMADDTSEVTLASDSNGAPAAGTFIQRTISFDSGPSPAELGKTLRIDVTVPTQTGNNQADFDLFALTANPTVTSGVPEPGSVALGGSGLLLMLAGAVRRKLSR